MRALRFARSSDAPGLRVPTAICAVLVAVCAVLVAAPAVLAAAPVPAPSPAHAKGTVAAGTAIAVRYHDAAARLIGAALASDHAYLRLSQLCDGIGNRLSGSPQLERAVDWAQRAMTEDGLERVRRQAAMVPHWVRGAEHAEIVEPGPHAIAMLGLGRSVGTPPGGITADVIVVNGFAALDSLPADQVRGRIVLYDVPFRTYGETVRYRGSGANRAAARGAVAALVRSVGPVSLRTPHTGNMNAYVDSIPRIPAAAVTIEDAARIHRLTDRGERVRVHLEMAAQMLPDAMSYNVIGELRGREKPDEVVVVGGHLDSWDVGSGAQDDGCGVAISLEAVRLMKALGLRPRRTVRVVFWTNEENGTRGAQAYADSLGPAIEKHVAAIETDGGVERLAGFDVGVHQLGSDSADVARETPAIARMREIAPLFSGLGGESVNGGGGGADIGPLMRKGVPGVAHRTTMEHYFDWHHTQADMLDKIDPIEMRKNVAALAVMTYVLAEMPETLAPSLPPGVQAKALSRAAGSRGGR
ncbi:MAG: M20/M25/M40 family metallo-hydrolase [Candidatus Eisenbacteria bacterium]|nr:M20/M25/M40 family metallo-hydrolase [Candidatus Eisenbacteria bacterium]